MLQWLHTHSTSSLQVGLRSHHHLRLHFVSQSSGWTFHSWVPDEPPVSLQQGRVNTARRFFFFWSPHMGVVITWGGTVIIFTARKRWAAQLNAAGSNYQYLCDTGSSRMLSLKAQFWAARKYCWKLDETLTARPLSFNASPWGTSKKERAGF